MTRDRAALGGFLRARRDRLTPAQAGMDAFPGPRRVSGLRKEELAWLAGLSPDYYSRLEQGRQSTVTADVVDALARALRLDDVEHGHLRDLAVPTRRRRPDTDRPQQPDPGLLRLMTVLDHVPVVLLGRRSEVLARNALLRAVLEHPMEPGTLFVRYLFREPAARVRITNWDHFASAAVGGLRLEAGRRPDDRRLAALVDELRAADPDVARWWDDHGVRDHTSLTKHIDHPVAGHLAFDIEAVSGPHDADQRLIVYTVQPDSPTARALPMLTGWVEHNHGRRPGADLVGSIDAPRRPSDMR